MIKTLPTLLLITLLALRGQAQVLSKFTWDSNPITKADVGPNGFAGPATLASSVSGGAGGTNGLTPNGQNINMIVPGSVFLVPGLDISVDFRKKENGASFFKLGSFDFGLATGSIYIKYLVRIGGADVLRSRTTQFTVIDDGNFHTYRFVYNNTTGVATLSVDGSTVQTYTETAGTPLSWTGAGNAAIGPDMDGSGTTQAELDNLIIQLPPILLPVELLSFDATATSAGNQLTWTTSHESNVRDYTIERSTDGVHYAPIGIVAALKSSSGNNVYQYTDQSPAAVNFYRLGITDADGSFRYSAVKKIGGGDAVSISCYPNPVINYVHVKVNATAEHSYTLTTLDGKVVQSGRLTGSETDLNLAAIPKGLLILRIENAQGGDTFKLFKQ